MPINIKHAFTADRQIAQGEDYVIFFRILPSPVERGLDYVYAETDEGYQSTSIAEPIFGETLQLYYEGAVTSKFSVGDHYVRVWAVEKEIKYVLFETAITVNPGFPLTEEQRYSYKSKFLTDSGNIKIPEVQSEGMQKGIKTYPIFRGKVDSPFQFKSIITLYLVPNEESKPDHAFIGDLCLIDSEDDTGYLYVCVEDTDLGCKWKRISEKIFEGSFEGLVPVSVDETQDMYLKGDGTWSKVGRESLQEEDFILDKDFVLLDCDFN